MDNFIVDLSKPSKGGESLSGNCGDAKIRLLSTDNFGVSDYYYSLTGNAPSLNSPDWVQVESATNFTRKLPSMMPNIILTAMGLC